MRLFLLIFFSLIKTVVYAQHTLPIIKLTGEFGYDYQEGIVSIIYPDGSSDNNLSARIKWRG